MDHSRRLGVALALTALTAMLTACNEHSVLTAPRAICAPSTDTLHYAADTLLITHVDSACAITVTKTHG